MVNTGTAANLVEEAQGNLQRSGRSERVHCLVRMTWSSMTFVCMTTKDEVGSACSYLVQLYHIDQESFIV